MASPVRARLCLWLREAAESDSAPYFYEAYLSFAQEQIPIGDGYEDWRQERALAMESGKESYYCGNPNQVPPERSYPWVTVTVHDGSQCPVTAVRDQMSLSGTWSQVVTIGDPAR